MKLKLPLSTKYLANCFLHGRMTYLCFICLQAMSIDGQNFNTFCFVVQDFLHNSEAQSKQTGLYILFFLKCHYSATNA